jgi:hypothetical protein
MLSGLAWPSSSYDPVSGAGEISVPKRGMIISVHYELGEPTVSFSQPVPQAGNTIPSTSATAAPQIGGDDGTYANQGHSNFRGVRPPDVLPGDWIRMGSQGNLVGVMEGGLTLLKASELAQVVASRTNDLLRLIGRNMDILTDFGEFRFTNKNGNCSMQMRAGSKQTTQTSPLKENYTIRADLGDTGQLVNFRVTDPDGHTLSSVNMDPNGSVTRTAAGDTLDTVFGKQTERVDGDREFSMGGDLTEYIFGNASERVSANKTVQAGADVMLQSGNDTGVFSNRDISIGASRNMTVAVSGDTSAISGVNALEWTVNNGSVEFNIGDPSAGDTGGARSGWTVMTNTGNMLFSTNGGNFIVDTTTPNSVWLGGSEPLYHAAVYEMFQVFISTMGALIDSHTHLSPAGPTSPPVVPPYSTSSSLVPNIQSEYVALGG